MPKYNNSFASPDYIEEVIKDSQGMTIGTIRLKPSGVLWKPSGQHQYYNVTLAQFAAWITSCPEATRCGSEGSEPGGLSAADRHSGTSRHAAGRRMRCARSREEEQSK